MTDAQAEPTREVAHGDHHGSVNDDHHRQTRLRWPDIGHRNGSDERNSQHHGNGLGTPPQRKGEQGVNGTVGDAILAEKKENLKVHGLPGAAVFF